MKYTAQHGLTDRTHARSILEHAYEAYKVRLSAQKPTLSWSSEHEASLGFTALGKTISVGIHITDQDIIVEGDMPFLFRPFEGKIKQVIAEEMQKWIAKAQSGAI